MDLWDGMVWYGRNVEMIDWTGSDGLVVYSNGIFPRVAFLEISSMRIIWCNQYLVLSQAYILGLSFPNR